MPPKKIQLATVQNEEKYISYLNGSYFIYIVSDLLNKDSYFKTSSRNCLNSAKQAIWKWAPKVLISFSSEPAWSQTRQCCNYQLFPTGRVSSRWKAWMRFARPAFSLPAHVYLERIGHHACVCICDNRKRHLSDHYTKSTFSSCWWAEFQCL